MGASKIYASTDVGAPVLNGITKGSFINVLMACLVNGYGSKTGLGWTTPFNDPGSNTRVFRNNHVVGTGCFLRAQDNGAYLSNNLYNQFFTLKLFSTMDTAHTGTDPIPFISYSIGCRSVDYVDVPIRWYLIGDNRGFYFICYPYHTDTTWPDIAMCYYVGDIQCFIPGIKIYALFGNNGAISYFGGPTLSYPSYGAILSSRYGWVNKNPITLTPGISYPGPTYALLLPSFPTAINATIGAPKLEIPKINGVPHSSGVLVMIDGGTIIGTLPGIEGNLELSGTIVLPEKTTTKFLVGGGATKLQVSLKSESDQNQNYPPSVMFTIGNGFRA
jgi:hypothetical protein